MRKLHYENQGTNTYLVYEIGEQETVDSMSLGMLTNNKIHGLAQTIFTQMDNKRIIKYNVSSKVPASHFFSRTVNEKLLLGVFKGIVNAMLSAEDYMLEPSSIILEMDCIFTDVLTCETNLICLPICDTEMKKVDLGPFFRNIMFNTQFDQTEKCDYVAKIINYLNGTPLFSLTDFKKLLEDIESQKTQLVAAKANNGSQLTKKPSTQPKEQVQSVLTKTPPAQNPKTTLSPASSDSGGTVPPGQDKRIPEEQENPESTGPEISFFYLMQHYNKENAAAYKAQKEAKKRAAAAAKEKAPTKQAPAKKQSRQDEKPANDFGFAVPGQAAPAPVAKPAAQPKAKQTPPRMQKAESNTPAQRPAYVPREVPQGKGMDFGETIVLGGGSFNETTVLTSEHNSEQMAVPYLVRKKNNEKISLNKPVFRVGKERGYVDYHVGDNVAISRSHASFITRDDKCFVVDTNSTNHTFVNGNMIQSGVETQISDGDLIRLANEDFEFKLY